MLQILYLLLIIIGAYLIGSLSSAIMLCNLAGFPDPRAHGSGNPGATNVLRFGNKELAAMVLIIDILKGVVPVVIACFLGLNQIWIGVIALFSFLGHLYPIFFEFKGGKGVATALGGFLALSPIMAGATLLTWLVAFLISRISSISAITAAVITPVYSLWLIDSIAIRWIAILIAIMLLLRHGSNIHKLIHG